MKFSHAAALTLCTIAAACGTQAPSGRGSAETTAAAAVMNDVSVLYPLAKSQAEFNAYLPATGLLPQSIFDVASAGLHPPSTTVGPNIATLRLVAFRLDPCTAQEGPVAAGQDASCLNEMRLVFQPLAFQSGKTTASDMGFHVLFNLTRAQLTQAVNDIITLRLANAANGVDGSGPLAVHPIMAKQGLTGAMAKGLNQIVQKYTAGLTVFRVAAFAGIFSQHTSWKFQTVNVNADGSTTPFAIPTLPAASSMVEVGNEGGGFDPANKVMSLAFQVGSPDNISALLSNTAPTTAMPVLQSAFNAATKIENPNFHSVLDIDCMSCHAAETARSLIGIPKYGLSDTADAFQAAPGIDTSETSPPSLTTAFVINFHMFSYGDSSTPTINTRVINDTAFALNYVNTVVLSGASPSGDAGVVAADAGVEASAAEAGDDAEPDGSDEGSTGEAGDDGGASDDGGSDAEDDGG